MSFLQFLGYYIAAEIIFQGVVVSLLLLRNKLQLRRVNALKKTRIRAVTEEELLDMVDQIEDKKQWN
jgi:hypothetical protein